MKDLVLCIDLGSSSVRCSLYELPPNENEQAHHHHHHHHHHGGGGGGGGGPIQQLRRRDDGQVVSAARSWQAVLDGKIQWWQPQSQQSTNDSDNNAQQPLSLLDLVDASVQDVLDQVKQEESVQIVAVGFSSLVMNLVGVDSEGQVIPQATACYACNQPAVANKVKELQRYVCAQTCSQPQREREREKVLWRLGF